jgi:hypothetical protein
MGRHSLVEPDGEKSVADSAPVSTSAEAPTGSRPEPVAIAAAAQAVISAGVTIGWVALDDQSIQIIVTAVGAIAALVFTFIARSQVTPIKDPVLRGNS